MTAPDPHPDAMAAADFPAAAASGAVYAAGFGALPDPVVLVDAVELLPAFGRVQSGWRVTARPIPGPEAAGRPLSALARTGDGYVLASRYLERPMSGLSAAAAVCGLIADIAQAHVEANAGGLTLHCGAVRRGGRLIVLTGPARAGKSTLVARLAAESDGEVVCDDVLPVDPSGRASALGFFPRLRLPLPEGAAPGFRAFVERSLALADTRYGYVVPARAVPCGPAGRIGAVVLLDRRPDGPARLEAVAPEEAARHLLMRNMNDRLAPEAALAQVARLTGEAAACRLVYADLEEAVALLARAFPAGPAWPATPLALAPAAPAAGEARDAPPLPLALRVAREARVSARPIGGTLCLSHPEEREVLALNPVGAAVWQCLEQPASGREVARALAEAFPAAAPDRIAEDVAAVLGALHEARLIAIGGTARQSPPPDFEAFRRLP